MTNSGMARIRATAAVAALVVAGLTVLPAGPAAGSGRAAAAAVPGYTPSQIQSIYRIPRTRHPQRIAVVTGNQFGNVQNELSTYRAHFHLPPCTTANKCFHNYQVSDSNLGGRLIDVGLITTRLDNATETALDVEAVSAMCPECRIDLVNAAGDASTSTSAAIYFATHKLGDRVVSFSYSGTESGSRANAKSDDAAIATDVPRGHTLFAASGDTGGGNAAGPSAPSNDRRVVSVGGTTVRRSRSGRWVTTAWNGTTTGCSAEFSRPAYQRSAHTGCGGRAETDVSALANPNTGFATYVGNSWEEVGGTSLATPLVAAMTARLGLGGTVTPATFYRNRRFLIDVVRGNTLSGGGCGGAARQICVARKGWDGPTGNGTPRGAAGFTGRR